MTIQVSGVRGWITRRTPIQPPGIVEVDIGEQVSALSSTRAISQIELPLLDQPLLEGGIFLRLTELAISQDLSEFSIPEQPHVFQSLIQAGIHGGNLAAKLSIPEQHLGWFVPLAQPQNVNARMPVLADLPDIIDVFDPLHRPARVGKSYGAASKSFPLPTLWDGDNTQQDTNGRSVADYCRHGMVRSICSMCSGDTPETRQSRKASHLRTVDVFDLLRPYLQPPLEAMLSEPELFPAGRRPYPYQIDGIKFLASHSSALLGDEMGLGKTIQTIITLQKLYRQGTVQSTLILCPRSLLSVWDNEVQRWAPEFYLLRVRGSRAERLAMWRAPATVYLTTYETLREDIDDVVRLRGRFGVVVLDEVQKIKNAATATTRAVRRIQAQFQWGLSGTPLENRLDDVITIFDYLKPSLFNTQTALTLEVVKQSIQPYFLRRRTADVYKELPAKIKNEIWLELSEKQKIAYQRKETEGKNKLAVPGATRIHVFALINELKQICNFDPVSGESCKADYLEEQLDSIVASGQKALIFSHLPHVSLTKLMPRLQEYAPAMFDGSLSDQRREVLIRQFQAQNQAPNVLLMSVQTGGIGITLTAANHVFHFDHWWNPAVSRQAEGRAHRIGQSNTVFVHDIFTKETIEQRIYDLLSLKQNLFDRVIDDLSSDQVAKVITDDELFGLFGLRPPPGSKVLVPPTQPPVHSRVNHPLPPLTLFEAALPQPSAPEHNSGNGPRKLSDLSPSEFERYIAKLYARMGYKAKVTPQSHDHGVDIFARRYSATGEETLLIQCKHKIGGTVGEAAVRDLIGALQIYHQANAAHLVTSGSFSTAAITLANQHRIHLVDYLSLKTLADSFKQQ